MIQEITPQLDLVTMGKRFREERDHWRDDELAECLLLKSAIVEHLEAGKLNPDAVLLFRMAASGLDVQYILTGTRSSNWYQVASDINGYDYMEKVIKLGSSRRKKLDFDLYPYFAGIPVEAIPMTQDTWDCAVMELEVTFSTEYIARQLYGRLSMEKISVIPDVEQIIAWVEDVRNWIIPRPVSYQE